MVNDMRTEEVLLNQEAYDEKWRADLERDHRGQIALMHDRELVAVYNDEADAYTTGEHFFGLGKFSLVRIGETPAHLGIQTASILT